jgi:hypothetical protein
LYVEAITCDPLVLQPLNLSLKVINKEHIKQSPDLSNDRKSWPVTCLPAVHEPLTAAAPWQALNLHLYRRPISRPGYSNYLPPPPLHGSLGHHNRIKRIHILRLLSTLKITQSLGIASILCKTLTWEEFYRIFQFWFISHTYE